MNSAGNVTQQQHIQPVLIVGYAPRRLFPAWAIRWSHYGVERGTVLISGGTAVRRSPNELDILDSHAGVDTSHNRCTVGNGDLGRAKPLTCATDLRAGRNFRIHRPQRQLERDPHADRSLDRTRQHAANRRAK